MASSPPLERENDSQPATYERRNPRINKPDMFMNTALWMEMSPLAECPDNFGSNTQQHERDHNEGENAESKIKGKPIRQESADNRPTPEKVHKSGAVFVLPNDRALSVDCSKGGVHAAVCALNKFGQERAKGCQVYLSRRPCSFCAKLLVQCEVSKVYFLPIEPEWNDPVDIHRVDNIFKSSSTALSIFIPRVRDSVISDVKNQDTPYTKDRDEEAITRKRQELEVEYWSDEWVENASEVLRWPAFSDKMKEQTMKDMRNLIEWVVRVTYGDVPDGIKFAEIDPTTKKAKVEKHATGENGDCVHGGGEQGTSESPTPSSMNWQEHALHMSRMARMLSQRSDDPTRRVGCALLLHNEVVAIGWNGFPAKALYGEFPRASSTDAAVEKKEPYVIHAEQNALLTRNKRNMKHNSSILFNSVIPAHECIPMLVEAGVKNIVLPNEPNSEDAEYKPFFDALKAGKLIGYWPKSVPNSAVRNLNSMF